MKTLTKKQQMRIIKEYKKVCLEKKVVLRFINTYCGKDLIHVVDAGFDDLVVLTDKGYVINFRTENKDFRIEIWGYEDGQLMLSFVPDDDVNTIQTEINKLKYFLENKLYEKQQ